MPKPTVVRDSSSWGFQDYEIERLMDHAALTSAHPDNTLILAGPPRWVVDQTGVAMMDKLLPLGVVQNFQVAQTIPVQPMMAIGSARAFYLTGKPQGTVAITRLFCDGRNLLRALMTNAVQAGLDPTLLDDRASASNVSARAAGISSPTWTPSYSGFRWVWLVSSWTKFTITWALSTWSSVRFRAWALGFGAGQSMILENVNLLFDRLYPIDATQLQNRSNTQPSDTLVTAALGTVDSTTDTGLPPESTELVRADLRRERRGLG